MKKWFNAYISFYVEIAPPNEAGDKAAHPPSRSGIPTVSMHRAKG